MQVATTGQQAAYVQTDTNEITRTAPEASSYDTVAPAPTHELHEEGEDTHG
jgi:hypothetical protein